MTPTRALPVLLCAALVGCGGGDDALQNSSSYASEFVCSASNTEPGMPRAYFAPFDPVEQEVLCVLDRAQHELVVAHYNIRRDSYLNKLVELAARGVEVKVAVDATNAAQSYNLGDDYLEENGIDLVRVKPPGSRSLMHLKVAVIDSTLAMTGSFNWNGTAALANDENMLVTRDAELVARYREQVLEVRGDQPHLVQGGVVDETTSLHFCPEEHLDTVLVDQIGRAQTSIDVAMFTLTRRPVADALVAALNAGVRVRLVTEAKRSSDSTVVESLEAAGALVVRGANRIGAYSAMHQKYAVIDEATVLTGATNWTTGGTRNNDEDLLIVDDPTLAEAYRRNFADLLWVYAGIDDPEIPAPSEAGVLLHAIHDATAWGDRVVVTGNHPALGSWDPHRGLVLDTSESMFPSWTTRLALPAGTRLEYKYVTLTAAGESRWEPGPNRVIDVPSNGRALVISGRFGDTSTSWTPRDPLP